MTTMSSAASMVSMPFLFPVNFLIFFTPFVFPVGLSLPVPQVGCKPGLFEKATVDVLAGTDDAGWKFLAVLVKRGFSLRYSFGCRCGLPRRPRTWLFFVR